MNSEHEHLISYKQALAWLIAALGFIVTIAFGAGAAHLRISGISVELEMLRGQIELVRSQAESQSRTNANLESRLSVIATDMAWQTETTRLIAQKLDVSIPQKAR